jgi:hypothetical protein
MEESMSPLHPDDLALFEAARGHDDPSVGDQARMQKRLAARLGAATVGLAATSSWTAGAVAAFGSTGAKVVAAIVLVTSVGVGSVAASRSFAVPSALAPAPTARVTVAAAPPAQPTVSAASPPMTANVPTTATNVPPPPTARPASPTPMKGTRASAPSSSSSLQGQLESLARADVALREGDATRALALLDDDQRRYPSSALDEERAVERILALCAAGHIDQARSAAASFARANASSPYESRLRASCVRDSGSGSR